MDKHSLDVRRYDGTVTVFTNAALRRIFDLGDTPKEVRDLLIQALVPAINALCLGHEELPEDGVVWNHARYWLNTAVVYGRHNPTAVEAAKSYINNLAS